MNFMYRHHVVPTSLAHDVMKMLRMQEFRPTVLGESAPQVWTPTTQSQKLTLTSLWDSTLPSVSVFHYTSHSSLPSTTFPMRWGNMVAMVLLGNTLHFSVPAMQTTLRIPNRSVLLLEDMCPHATSVPQGECYAIMFYKEQV